MLIDHADDRTNMCLAKLFAVLRAPNDGRI